MVFLPRLACIVVVLALVLAAKARADGPAEPLLKLVPPDAAVTFVVEDLRGQARALVDSPLYEKLNALPMVREWRTCDAFRRLEVSVKRAETILGENARTIRDDLFGEAVVLTLRIPPGGRPDEARGLLLVKVPDKALLDRLVDGINAGQLKSGELTRVSERMRGATAYRVREFRPGLRDDEYFASLGDRVFAWSNSEELIQGVIDRQSAVGGGLSRSADFQKVRSRLPAHGLASVFVDPRFLERLLAASPRPEKPDEIEFVTLLSRYLASVRYFGAELEHRDGLILHTEEAVDPKSFDPATMRWAARSERPDPSFRRVPLSALAMATADIDVRLIVEGLRQIVPDRERPRMETIRLALSGLLHGLDVPSQVLPYLGHGTLFYVEKPGIDKGSGRLSWALSIEIGKGDGSDKAAQAIDNALRTALAIYALDEKHGGGRLQVESSKRNIATITALSESTPFAYAVAGGRLVLGPTPGAVARALDASVDPHGSDRVERVRSIYFPDTSSFFLADLRSIHQLALAHRSSIARRLATRQNRSETEVTHDLDQALALIELFDAVYLTTSIAPDFTEVHHALGLVRLVRPRP